MNLERLKWTKNVKREDAEWAYLNKVGDLFKLAWRDNKADASKPLKRDLILLRQKGFVTHLVKVLDEQPEREDWEGDYNIYRIVEVLWAIDFANPPASAKADEVFGYSEVLSYRGGNVMELRTLPSFNQRWDNDGGLAGFQSNIQSLLTLLSND